MDDRTVDSIFSGSLKCLPPVSSKIVRIFTSSTFTDTTMERNTLMAQCYPKLKDYCREKHGLEFQVVDMRWGVRDEATDDHMTTELCMREIENCQRLSMGPNFVVFLGQKYGYRPIPTYILSSELQLLRDELVASGTDVTLLDTWYRKDSNAVPAISVLQPISSILVNFNNKRIPKLQQHDQAVWWDTLGKMQKLFRKSAHSLYSAGKLDKDSMHNYFMSVTEREVINGILNVKNTKNHCLAYIRYINNINLQNIKKASLYIDILNRSVDSEAVKLLADLRDVRVPNRIETTNIQKYHIDWIGREGLDTETHGEYLQHFITHFYRNIVKLVDRAMRKEDSSAQGQIVTEILQHLHVCNNSVKVFYGREENLERIENYMLGDNDKPLVLYGEGGCGKTSLLAKCVELSANKWFANAKPVCVIRFLGTTPDSSALAPALLSICQQISYNYMLPLEDIPTELVPLQALLKQLLTLASPSQPLLLFLDSVDQLKGAQDAANKVSWLPLALPKLCKIIVSCAAEENNQEVSKDYHLLSRMIDNRDNFIEVTALGEELALNVMKMWMKTNGRDLTNYQWRLVCNTIEHCSLPILVKLVFAEVSRWRSYTKPQDTKLANTVTDSIMMLFQRIEKQHGRLLVFHALAYITASKSGLSESELEDLISLDDKVLDDVYQYHLPPVRRIPPLLWTRIRNDLPNYLTEREADGVSVCNWYHRQFRETAKEMYFKNQNMAIYFHSMIADYFLGIWGGGQPKPFKYTEIQRHRFNLTDRDGAADRKVPLMPLVFYTKDGKISRYNLRKFGEMPFHFVRSRRFEDLFKHVLFNYEWLHAKLSSCPLQAVLADYEDACNNLEVQFQRELILVADALRLGGAILGVYPDMLAPQLIGRLLPEMGPNKNVHMLLKQCDALGPKNCAILPIYHCLHTPGGPLKYSLEGHQFAVFGFCLTSDFRYIVSISNRFLTWDLSTSDLARDVNPALEGLMQQLCLSPDNRFAAAFTNNNQTVLLNTLTSEYVIIDNPLPELESLEGIFLLNARLFIHGSKFCCAFNMKGKLIETLSSNEPEWNLIKIDYLSEEEYLFIFWKGNLEIPDMMIKSFWGISIIEPFNFHSVIVLMKNKKTLYCCYDNNNFKVAKFIINYDCCKWIKEYELPSPNYKHGEEEEILQLKIDYGRGGTGLGEQHLALLATTYNGFVIWDLGIEDIEHGISSGPPEEALVLSLPHGIHNISTRILESNSIMISVNRDLAVAGVRKNLYVWNLENFMLVKVLDAHFGRIISLEPLIIGNWNYVITSSIDRSVKVWNINNIFEQVHVIDRHELQIDAISLSELSDIAVTVTRGCIGVWDIRLGKLVSKLADSPLGAIVTHALITPDAKYIISAESGNILVWNRATEQVISKDDQQGIRQLTLIDNGIRLLSISLSPIDNNHMKALIVMRNIPEGNKEFSVTCLVKASIVAGSTFNPGIVNSDGSCIAVLSIEKSSKDIINIYSSRNGQIISKIPIKITNKEILGLVAMPNKSTTIGYITQEKVTLLDIKTKKIVRSIPKWAGICTKDGKYGLYAPSRGGLELIELKKGSSVRTFIPKVAEGVFSVLCMFNSTDQYVLYYHSGKKTIRVFRTQDGQMIANFRVQTELSAIASTADGLTIVLGTADGCVTALSIADPLYPELAEDLKELPSRDPDWKKKQEKIKANARFKAAVNIAKLSTHFSNNSNEENGNETILED